MSKFKPSVDQLFASLKRCIQASDHVGAERASEEIIERAFEAIDQDDNDQAVAIGKRMQELGNPVGFEIEALVLDDASEPAKAVEVLERGLKAIPDAWRLWELLGNIHSDEARPDDAAKAYEKALACTGAEPASVRYNMALNLARSDKYDAALEAIEPVDVESLEESELRLNTAAFKTSVLTQLGRFDDAIGLATRVLGRLTDEDYTEESVPHIAELHAQLGRSQAEGKQDAEKAMKHALDAIRIDQGNELALSLVRAIRNDVSDKASLYQLTVKGTWHEPFEGESEKRDFRQTFAIIADSPEQALEMAREVSPDELRKTLTLEESEAVEALPEEPKGVCQVSPYMFYEDEDGDEPGSKPSHKHGCGCGCG